MNRYYSWWYATPQHAHDNTYEPTRRADQNDNCGNYMARRTSTNSLANNATRLYLAFKKRSLWNSFHKRRLLTQLCTSDSYALSGINGHGTVPFFYPGQWFRLALRISFETTLAMPMFPTQHFNVDDFWYSAQLPRDDPAQPYCLHPFRWARLCFRLLSTFQTMPHPAMNLVALYLTVKTFFTVKRPASGYAQHATTSAQLNQS